MAELIQAAVVEAATDVYSVIGRDYKELDYSGVIQDLILAGELSGIDVLEIELSTVAKTGPFIPNFIPVSIREKIDLDSGEVAVEIDGVLVIP